MSVVFFAEGKKSKGYLSLPATVARHLLVALDYKVEEVARHAQLTPEDVLLRIAVVRRQFAQGCGREFTDDEVNERQMLEHLQELETVATRAHEVGRNVVLL